MRLTIAIIGILLTSVLWIVIGSLTFLDDLQRYNLLLIDGSIVMAFTAWAVIEIVIMMRNS